MKFACRQHSRRDDGQPAYAARRGLRTCRLSWHDAQALIIELRNARHASIYRLYIKCLAGIFVAVDDTRRLGAYSASITAIFC